jgi:mannose-6-phosphate isomerase-like protein (cupin superfamily)
LRPFAASYDPSITALLAELVRQQLGQEEVYAALKGSGTLEADGEQYPLDTDHIARVGPEVKRKVTPGPEGIRLLIVGNTPGEAYDPGGRL